MRGRVGRGPHPARSTRSSSRPRRAAAKPSRPPSKKAPRKGSKPRIKVEPPSVDQQPVEVVIKVKNKRSAPPKKTQQQAQPVPKRAASSGKVGKRKEKVKKEALKKAASADPRGLVDFVQVSVYTKVIPSPPVTEPSAQPKKPKGGKTPKKEKEKPEKKKPEKKEKETKTEPEVKTEKDNQAEKDAPPKKPSSTPKEGKIKKTVKEVKSEIKIKKEPPEEKEEKETIEEEDNEVIIDKVVTPEKKKKNKPKNLKNESKDGKQAPKKPEPKPKDTTDQDKAKATKPKIKVESISPVTVKDEKESDCSAPPSPVPEDTPGTSKQKKGKEKEEKVSKGKTQKKDAPKKKASKKPPPKPVIKEEPVFLEKRHREASLNALAKVHCLYENESRGAMNEILDKSIIKKKDVIKTEKVDPEEVPEKEEVEKSSRTLRSAPGMRGMGRYWDTTHLPTSSSSSSSPSSSSAEEEEKKEEEEEAPESSTEKPPEKKARKRRKRCEVRMDLKDMVVTKRMASLNASAMMAASYSVERRSSRGSRSDDSSNSSKESSDDEVVVSGASKKVAVIVNQDADLTITGLYTTRSTRHEGYCSIAGMQYRISSTSHTQTEATAVSSETLIHTTDHVSLSHSESGGSEHAGTSSPGGSLKSYTPLGALSSMQPPGQSRPSSSAFSAPPYHPHPQEIHGYYQPAGPLIQHAGKSATPEPPATYAPPPYPYPSPYPPEYSPYYSRGGYRRPWAPDPYLEPYPHPAAGYYHPYPAPPPPPPPPPPPTACYGSPVRAMPFIAPNIRQEPYDQGFQCPCPMQSACPKNVHTGPLTGASKGSEIEAPQTEARLPVALALPPESAISPGPPSPARGSVGMPPSSSPALSTARKERWSPPADIPDIKPSELTMEEEEEETKPLVLAPTKRRAKRTPGEEQGRKRKKLSSTKHKTKGSKLAVLIEEKDEKNNNELLLDKVALRPPLKLSNGWSWEGEPFQAKVMRTTEDVGSYEKCYPAMRHVEGDVIRPRDCILLRSGPKKNLPFVAKVSAMWENPEDGEMMVSVLWYYRPEHTEAGPIPNQPPDEIFASRHKDTNSVACIEDKCYVLTYHEYARYRKSLVAGNVSKTPVVPPPPEGYPRRDLLPPGQVASDLIFFCRQVYDFRQKKVLKKPPSQLPLRT